ncbi:hypothetical protein BJ170DRAFT_599827 [Xylariales sp. AK1849]|nr:hypothetical protein BJ170DRAFT_599827 [Xylariales sp. AK1849]
MPLVLGEITVPPDLRRGVERFTTPLHLSSRQLAANNRTILLRASYGQTVCRPLWGRRMGNAQGAYSHSAKTKDLFVVSLHYRQHLIPPSKIDRRPKQRHTTQNPEKDDRWVGAALLDFVTPPDLPGQQPGMMKWLLTDEEQRVAIERIKLDLASSLPTKVFSVDFERRIGAYD